MTNLTKACFVSLGLLLIVPPLANAQVGSPNWRKGGCSNRGGCNYFKVIRRNYPFVLAKEKTTMKGNICDKFYCTKDTEVEFNCDGWQSRFRYYSSTDGKPYKWEKWTNWSDILPGTVGEGNLRAACRP